MALVLALLKRGARLPLDQPNERSLHVAPVPRIGGLGIVAGTLLAFVFTRAEPLLAALVAALAAVSFIDDRAHLPAALRFAAHIAAAAIFVFFALPDVSVVWRLALVIAAVWLTNLYNFMDGSDGLAGGMALFGFGAYALAAWLAGDVVFTIIAASIAAAALAFLAFNFHPARVFMGDAGSIPLGFLSAALGLLGWRADYWPLWFPVLVFAPFFLDASVTLARRIVAGERFWEAHRSHYYQRLVQLGWGHRNTALAEYALMAACGAAALWSLGQSQKMQWMTLAGAAICFVVLATLVDVAWRKHASTQQADARAH